MQIRKFSVLAVGLLMAAPICAQESARAIIERAIKAHGGEEKLTKVRADKVKLKGTLVLGTRETSFTAETAVQLPGQFKNIMHVKVDDRTITLVQILNGDTAYVTVDGQPQKVEPAALAEMKETMQLDRAVRLVALLSDKSFTLEVLPETKVNDIPVTGIKVVKGRKELRMFFDKKDGFLVKIEHKLDDKEGKEIKQEQFFSDFQDLGGYRRPVKVTAFREGKKVMEATLTDVKYFERIDDAEFAKP